MNTLNSPIHLLRAEIDIPYEARLKAIQDLEERTSDSLSTLALLEILDESHFNNVDTHQIVLLKKKAISILENRFVLLLETKDHEYLHDFMTQVLNFCFQRSSKHSLSFRTLLFTKVSNYLLVNLTQFENLRSYILSQTIRISKLKAQKDLISAAIQFHKKLLDNIHGASVQPTKKLLETRKFNVYMSKDATEDSVIAYLNHDHSIPVEKLERRLFAMYRCLLNVHQDRPKVILKAFHNLRDWLSQLPQTMENLRQYLSEIKKISQNTRFDWDTDCSLPIRLHLYAHAELVPNPNRRNNTEMDIIELMGKILNYQEAAYAMQAGFEVLALLPGLRRNVHPLILLIQSPNMRKQPPNVWKAAFDACKNLLSGLSLYDPTSDPQNVQHMDHHRIRKSMLRVDAQLRSMLSEIVFPRLSPQYPKDIRKLAWRSLLMSNPPNRNEWFHKALSPVDWELLPITLDMAKETRFRNLWNEIEPIWEELTSEHPHHNRIDTFTILCQALQQISPFEMVKYLIPIAFDDPDPTIRERARLTLENASMETSVMISDSDDPDNNVCASGYTQELNKESQRREILRLASSLDQINKTIIAIEETIDRLIIELNQSVMKRTNTTISIQISLQQRDALVTEGWIDYSELQVRMHSILEQLQQALQEAKQLIKELDHFKEKLDRQLEAIKQQQNAIRQLVEEQIVLEKNIKRTQKEIGQLRQNISSAESSIRRIEREIITIRDEIRQYSHFNYSDDHDVRLEQEIEINNKRNKAEKRLRNKQREVDQYFSSIQSYQTQISGAESKLSIQRDSLNAISRQIQTIRQSTPPLQRAYDQSLSVFNQRKSSYEAVRRRIVDLRGIYQSIESEYANKRRKKNEQMDQSNRELNRFHQQLEQIQKICHQISKELATNKDSLQQNRTKSQQLGQQIEAGRKHYDVLAKRALVESPQTDAMALSGAWHFIFDRYVTDFTRIFYVEHLARSLKSEQGDPIQIIKTAPSLRA